MNNYTNEEIQSNINKLTAKSDSLKLQRTAISKDINQIKKQIQYWQEMDLSQLKIM